jgi:hypothetical protein
MQLKFNKFPRHYILISLLAVVAVCLTSFATSEMSGEVWGYWYFARVLTETGKFIITDRSPVYVLYLSFFTWMRYPLDVTAEYIVTTTITVSVLIYFVRRYLGIWLGLLAACLWLPFIQVAEPPVQKLALALSLIAILVRNTSPTRFRLALSYGLLFLAYLFRQNYLVAILVFVAFDAFLLWRGNQYEKLASWRPKLATDWPIFVGIALYVCFQLNQSPHPWSNVWFSTTDWFPGDGKTMANGGATQCFNWSYMLRQYGTVQGLDFYFTNKEAFDGQTSLVGIFLANPVLISQILFTNLKSLILVMLVGSDLPTTGVSVADKAVAASMLGAILFGAFRGAQDIAARVYIFACLAMLATTALDIPRTRYMFPMIPIFVMAISWYSTSFSNFIKKSCSTTNEVLQKMATAIAVFGLCLLVFGWCSAVPAGTDLTAKIYLYGAGFAFLASGLLFCCAKMASVGFKDKLSKSISVIPAFFLLCFVSKWNFPMWAAVHPGSGRVLQGTEDSMKASLPSIAEKVSGCKGIMSLEHTFFGAFLDMPRDRIFDIWEMPPFGTLNNSEYKGLKPERIDCVLVSKNFATNVGVGTNYQIRYQNYIVPYIKELQSLGAVTYDIPQYGQAIILYPKNSE